MSASKIYTCTAPNVWHHNSRGLLFCKVYICLSNCTADQRLCFHCIGSTMYLLSKSEISTFKPGSVTAQPGLCRTWLETQSVGFSHA